MECKKSAVDYCARNLRADRSLKEKVIFYFLKFRHLFFPTTACYSIKIKNMFDEKNVTIFDEKLQNTIRPKSNSFFFVLLLKNKLFLETF